MDKKQTAQLLMLIHASYPKQADAIRQPEVAEIWHGALQDLDFDLAKLALTKWVMTEKWMPTIADIREVAAGISYGEIMDWSEAWEITIKAVRSFGYYNARQAMESFDDLTRETVKRIGFTTLCEMETDQREIMRAQFRDIYTQIADRRKSEQQMPLALREKIKNIGVPKNERLTRGESV